MGGLKKKKKHPNIKRDLNPRPSLHQHQPSDNLALAQHCWMLFFANFVHIMSPDPAFVTLAHMYNY